MYCPKRETSPCATAAPAPQPQTSPKGGTFPWSNTSKTRGGPEDGINKHYTVITHVIGRFGYTAPRARLVRFEVRHKAGSGTRSWVVCAERSMWRHTATQTCADARHRSHGDGDKAKATSILDESLQISTGLGMRPLMERVLSKRDLLKA
jgi:hypothetical protein